MKRASERIPSSGFYRVSISLLALFHQINEANDDHRRLQPVSTRDPNFQVTMKVPVMTWDGHRTERSNYQKSRSSEGISGCTRASDVCILEYRSRRTRIGIHRKIMRDAAVPYC